MRALSLTMCPWAKGLYLAESVSASWRMGKITLIPSSRECKVCCSQGSQKAGGLGIAGELVRACRFLGVTLPATELDSTFLQKHVTQVTCTRKFERHCCQGYIGPWLSCFYPRKGTVNGTIIISIVLPPPSRHFFPTNCLDSH